MLPNQACDNYKIERVSTASPELWTDFCQVLRDVRHFLTHAYPENNALQRFVDLAMNKTAWGKPVEVAERMISYFFEANDTQVPARSSFRIGRDHGCRVHPATACA